MPSCFPPLSWFECSLPGFSILAWGPECIKQYTIRSISVWGKTRGSHTWPAAFGLRAAAYWEFLDYHMACGPTKGHCIIKTRTQLGQYRFDTFLFVFEAKQGAVRNKCDRLHLAFGLPIEISLTTVCAVWNDHNTIVPVQCLLVPLNYKSCNLCECQYYNQFHLFWILTFLSFKMYY